MAGRLVGLFVVWLGDSNVCDDKTAPESPLPNAMPDSMAALWERGAFQQG